MQTNPILGITFVSIQLLNHVASEEAVHLYINAIYHYLSSFFFFRMNSTINIEMQ